MQQRVGWSVILVIVLLLGGVFASALVTIHDVTWPYDVDHLRDIGSAQSMADGNWFYDTAYAGEPRWYPPLVPAMLAGLHAITGLPLPIVHVRAGLVLGLLPVAALTALSWAWFGRVAALGTAAAALVLAQGQTPGWLSATYSPWIFSATFTLGLACLSLLAFSRHYWLISGLLAGLAALGDLGATLLLGIIVCLEAHRTWRSGDGKRAVMNLLTWGIPVAVIAAVHLAPLVWVYGLRTRNALPSSWRYTYVSIPMLKANVNVGLALAAIGLWTLQRDRSTAARLTHTWLGAAAVCFVYSYFGSRLGFPLLVPDWHFWLYLKAIEAVLAGRGLVATVARLPQRWRSERLIATAVLALVTLHVPSYLKRYDLTTAVELARQREHSDNAALVSWVRETLQPDDVVLADHETSVTVLVPAGHSVVCLDPYFSAPFVDWRERHRRHLALVQEPAGVSYLITTGQQARGTLVKTQGSLTVWRLR